MNLKSMKTFTQLVALFYFMISASVYTPSEYDIMIQSDKQKLTQQALVEDSLNQESVKIDKIEDLSVPLGLPFDKKYMSRSVNNCSGYGMRFHPIYKKKKKHKGIDFPIALGTPVKSTILGKVTMIFRTPKGEDYGLFIKIRSQSGYEILLAHLDKISDGIKIGSIVIPGQVVAYSGNSGGSTAPHLHYEVRELIRGAYRATDPIDYVLTDGVFEDGIML